MNQDQIREELRSSLTRQLAQLDTSSHCGAGYVCAASQHAEVRASIVGAGRLACEVEYIHATTPTLASLTQEELHGVADYLAKQMSYLEEALVVLEVDRLASQIQIRSKTPQIENESRSYFEVLVAGTGITLQRFNKQVTKQRKRVPATLTKAVFCRACSDLLLCIV